MNTSLLPDFTANVHLMMGIPRSGTTLCCMLLNQLPDTVALVEPLEEIHLLSNLTGLERIRALQRACLRLRKEILAQKKVTTRFMPGESLQDNSFSRKKNAQGLRKPIWTTGKVLLDKMLTDSFTLVVKHPNAFTALLRELINYFPCFALIRNPLAVLASWCTIQAPVLDGHAPIAEGLDPTLKRSLAMIPCRIQRQLSLLSWYFERYGETLTDSQILKYEDWIQNPGFHLEKLIPQANFLIGKKLENRNFNPLYDRETVLHLGEALLSSSGAYWFFYDYREVELLLLQWEGQQ